MKYLLLFRKIFLFPLARANIIRLGVYLLTAAVLYSSAHVYTQAETVSNSRQIQSANTDSALQALHKATERLQTVQAIIDGYKEKGIDTSEAEQNLATARVSIGKGDYQTSESILLATTLTLANTLSSKEAAEEAAAQKLAEEDFQKGTLTGHITTGTTPLSESPVTLFQNGTYIQGTATDSAGAYTLKALAGSYTVRAEHTGYATVEQAVEITAQQTSIQDISLVIPTPTPTPTVKATATPKAKTSPTPTPTVASSSTRYSQFYRTTTNSSNGSFSTYVMSFEMGAGKMKVIVDTAADSDCATDCPVLSVKDYVQRNGGIAGINGTYFCPRDYASCSGEINNFFWKILNPRVNKMINATNGLGENDPFLTFDSVGNPRLYSSWNTYMNSGAQQWTGINHKPLLTSGGSIVVNYNSLDDRQKTAKISRAALAVKGSTVYVIWVSSATIMDLASVVQTFGTDYSLNIDAGGSTGMYYNGSYKLGPGRNVPNALVFIEQ
jgi:exopolysaccharide biosynthesis protein